MKLPTRSVICFLRRLILPRFQNVEAEDALGRMIRRFSRRFNRIEDHAREQTRPLSSLSQSEMERVWQLAKRE